MTSRQKITTGIATDGYFVWSGGVNLQVLFLLFVFFFITAGFQMAVNGGMSRDAVNGKKTRILRYGDAGYF